MHDEDALLSCIDFFYSLSNGKRKYPDIECARLQAIYFFVISIDPITVGADTVESANVGTVVVRTAVVRTVIVRTAVVGIAVVSITNVRVPYYNLNLPQ